MSALDVSRPSAARSRRCSAAGRSRASSGTASSTTSSCRSPTSTARNPDDLSEIYVRGGNGQMVQLSNLVDVREIGGAARAEPLQPARAGDITANVAPGYSQGEALAALEAAAREVLPSTAQIDYNGQSREFKQASGDIYFIVRAGAGVHLPRARGPVRELRRSLHHHADRAAGDDRARCSRSSSAAAR